MLWTGINGVAVDVIAQIAVLAVVETRLSQETVLLTLHPRQVRKHLKT